MTKKNKDSLGGGAVGFLFKGVLYILYGRRAGEAGEEKVARVSLIIALLVVVFLALLTLGSLIGEYLF